MLTAALIVIAGLALLLRMNVAVVQETRRSRGTLERLNDTVCVLDYGAIGDGVTDDTTAFNRAIAALHANGGTVLIPDGRWAVNLIITKSGVTLRGMNSTPHRAATTWRGLTPYDPTKPAVQIGNDTAYVEDVRLENISIGANSGGTAATGLKLAGGTYRLQANGLNITGFARCLWALGGANYPVSFVNITNYSMHGGSQGAVTDGVVHLNYGAGQWLTAMYLVNGAISAAGGNAKRVWNDSCQVSISNTWVECGGTRKGLYIIKTIAGAAAPRFELINVAVDSANSADILLENMVSTSLRWSTYIFGANGYIDGLMENNAGATSVKGDLCFNAGMCMSKAAIHFGIFFPPDETATDETAKIAGSGVAGARRLELSSVGYMRLQSDNYVYVQGPAAGSIARLTIQELTGATQCQIDNNTGNLVLNPAAGKYVKAGDAAWNGKPFCLGAYYLWVDGTGRLRIKNGAPANDTDGTVVGTQV
jgi:hypothetical protein